MYALFRVVSGFTTMLCVQLAVDKNIMFRNSGLNDMTSLTLTLALLWSACILNMWSARISSWGDELAHFLGIGAVLSGTFFCLMADGVAQRLHRNFWNFVYFPAFLLLTIGGQPWLCHLLAAAFEKGMEFAGRHMIEGSLGLFGCLLLCSVWLPIGFKFSLLY